VCVAAYPVIYVCYYRNLAYFKRLCYKELKCPVYAADREVFFGQRAAADFCALFFCVCGLLRVWMTDDPAAHRYSVDWYAWLNYSSINLALEETILQHLTECIDNNETVVGIC